MIPFLKQVADHYYKSGGISERCFVFPNRRSLVFFQKYLVEAVAADGTAPIVAPKMMTMSDMFSKYASMEVSDRVTLLIELHECYSRLHSGAESLDDFIFWGDIILADFNDVDKYLADPKGLFANVAEYKSIQDDFSYLEKAQREAIEALVDHFERGSGVLTADIGSDRPDVKKRFFQIWNLLYPLYVEFNSHLLSKGMAYEGMVYRALADKVKAGSAEDLMPGNFVFVGLNAPNECEKAVMRRLQKEGRAEFCWDYSSDMIKARRNKSSFFMDKNVSEFPQAFSFDQEGLPEPVINVVSVPSAVGQVKCVPELLSRLPGKPDDCAVVLPDETLLMSLLNTIPEDVEAINVTMGYPMTSSELYTFMSEAVAAQLHTMQKKGKWYFYHRQVWSLFSSAFFRRIASEQDVEIAARVKKEAKYYIPVEDLNGSPLMDMLFRVAVLQPKVADCGQIGCFADYLTALTSVAASKAACDPEFAVEVEFARAYYRTVTLLKRIEKPLLPMTFVRLLNNLLAGITVPFKGEPLKGLQIMGPLETRALDFRNVILMSANEGVFPRKSVSSSFIPPFLRHVFGLPTYEHQDAIWAYYFYRMISRAENVWIFYDSRSEGLRSGEESRYIKQLEYDFQVPVHRYVVKADSAVVESLPVIEKTQEDIDAISSMSLSASALQSYIACPAKFWYEKIKRLRPEDEVVESLDNAMFGTVFHDTMWALYSNPAFMAPDGPMEASKNPDSVMSRVTKDYINEWLGRKEDIKAKVKALMLYHLHSVELEGRNIVVLDVIVQCVINTLKKDLAHLEEMRCDAFYILGLEQEFTGSFAGLKLKGFIDRLDSYGPDNVRVVDYKTGKVLPEDRDIPADQAKAEALVKKIFSHDTEPASRPKIALQFFIYDLLVRTGHNASGQSYDGRTVLNSVYETSLLFKEDVRNDALNESFYSMMKDALEQLFSEMLDPAVPFSRTSVEKNCEYCDFKVICGRTSKE